MHVLDVPYRSSSFLRLIYAQVSLLCLIVLCVFPVTFYVKLVAFFTLAIAVVVAWRHLVLLNTLERIQINEGALVLIVGDKAYPAQIVGEVFVNEFLLAFSCRFENMAHIFQRINVVILPDSMPKEDRRQLRLRLKNWSFE